MLINMCNFGVNSNYSAYLVHACPSWKRHISSFALQGFLLLSPIEDLGGDFFFSPNQASVHRIEYKE